MTPIGPSPKSPQPLKLEKPNMKDSCFSCPGAREVEPGEKLQLGTILMGEEGKMGWKQFLVPARWNQNATATLVPRGNTCTHTGWS